MKVALLIAGCLLVNLALTNVADSKTIAKFETKDVQKSMDNEVLVDTIKRAVDEEVDEKVPEFNIKALVTQARRVVEVIKLIRTRDITGGIEFVKRVYRETIYGESK